MAATRAWTHLRLEAGTCAGLNRCQWVLVGPADQVLARHEMNLDPGCWQYEAAWDLPGYVRRHAAADIHAEREREIAQDVGTWIAAEVLGPVAEALAEAAPAVVRVVVASGARGLMFLPLQLASVRGLPLALQDVALVMATPADRVTTAGGGRMAAAPGAPPRILALFSLPQGGRALNLRRERLTLMRLFSGGVNNAPVRTLQYGVTRDRLAAVLAEPAGWDLIHISGHGMPGELMLETDEGLPDRIEAAELADLLTAARGVKLVTLSACWSAASATREQRRLLSLPATADDASETRQPAAGATASELAARLGCAVLAMRYPVEDGFAISLAELVYRELAIEGQPLPQSLSGALKQVLGPRSAALLAATPALFGDSAVGLTLRAQPATGALGAQGRSGQAGLPGKERLPVQAGTPGEERLPVPERFVGRVAVLARASAALSPRSGMCGVLLQGMPGAGKTACAAELAATHEHAFDKVIWFKLPEAESHEDFLGVLAELALAVERAVTGFRCAHLLADPGQFGEFKAQLTGCLERNRLLVVIDHIDSLLTSNGAWRDDRWGEIVSGLTSNLGSSRLVMTGRVAPRPIGTRMRTEPVGMLSLDEALLLARELPNFARLIDDGKAKLAARALEFAQGHPKLLELLDRQASDAERLTAALAVMGRAWTASGGLPDGFLATGQATATGEDYRRVLQLWTNGTAASLPPGHRDLFCFLCSLAEADRTPPAIEHNWPAIGDAPLDAGLRALLARGLITFRPDARLYQIQPAIAAQGRAQASSRFRELVDTRLSGYWLRVFEMAWTREGSDGDRAHLAGPLIARASLSACPYLIRLRQYGAAEALLSAVLRRDPSRPTVARVLPLLREIAAAAASTSGAEPPAEALIQVLTATNPAAAGRQARAELDAALDREDYPAASAAASTLIAASVRTGRLDDALALAEDAIGYNRQAGLGTWSQFHGEVQRLHVLVLMARPDQVLEEAGRLRDRMAATARERTGRESVQWWEVWEELHDTAQRAAIEASRWQQAVEYNAAAHASKLARGATTEDVAQALFPAYMPLLRLGRIDDALALLAQCREVFEEAGDFMALGEVFGALANVEDARGHGEIAIARGEDSLRYAYRGEVAACIAVSHANLGTYLHVHAGDAERAAAHHAAAALLGTLTGGRTAVVRLDHSAVPGGVAELCALVGQVPGVDLGGLLDRLVPDPGRLGQVYASLLSAAGPVAAASGDAGSRPGDDARAAAAVWGMVWEPVIAALVAAARGNTAARVKLRQRLAELDKHSPALATAMRRVAEGERGPTVLAGLAPLDVMVTERALSALAGQVDVAVELWPVMYLGIALGNLVAAAVGRTDGTEILDAFAADPVLAPMAPVLAEIVAGNRDPLLASQLRDPAQRAVIGAVLRQIAAVTQG